MYNIGIDVHKDKCVVAIKGESPEILKRTSFKNNAFGIVKFIDNLQKWNYLSTAEAACESTGNYYLLMYDMLKEAGIKTRVAHTYKLKIISESKYKDDNIDAEKLSELLRIKAIPECTVPDKAERDLRELVRTRSGMVGDIGKHRNRIEAILAKYPFKKPKGGRYTAIGLEWIRTIPVREVDRMALDMHLDSIEFISGQMAKFNKKIAEVSMNKEETRLIMTIPGIGHILAVTIMAEIINIKRFSSAEKLVSYAGLAPRRHNSAGVERSGGITKRGSTWLRTAMVEAALVAIRYDPHLRAIYERIADRRGPMKARVAVARRMLEAIWHTLTTNKPYRWEDKDLVMRKYERIGRIISCG